jgi:hypothetical protein
MDNYLTDHISTSGSLTSEFAQAGLTIRKCNTSTDGLY